MKKFIALLLLGGIAYAEPVTPTQSSTTQTNDTGYVAASNLTSVVIGATSAGGNITIWSSTYTTSVLVTSITLGTVFEYDFHDKKVAGIYYKTTGNTAGVTILYKR